MRGTRLRPRVVGRAVDPASGDIEEIEPETIATAESLDVPNWERIVEAMTGVVHGPRGTATGISDSLSYQIAGKTGTAQLFAIGQNEKYDAKELDKKLHDHGLFIAFAPVAQPRIAVAVVVENGGSGSSVAAPLAGIVIDAYLGDIPAPTAPGRRTLRAAAIGDATPRPASTIRPVPG